METRAFEIINDYPEEHFSNTEIEVKNFNETVSVLFGNQEEYRMGYWACEVKIYKNGLDLTKQKLQKNFIATQPYTFNPISFDKKTIIIPTSILLENHKILVYKTDIDKIFEVPQQSLISANHFSIDNQYILIEQSDCIYLTSITSESSIKVYQFEEHEKIEHSYFPNNKESIAILYREDKKQEQLLKKIDYTGRLLSQESITLPNLVFNFNLGDFKSISRDRFCLFNSLGHKFVANGNLFNRWSFVKRDSTTGKSLLRTYIPVSEVYYNKEWKQEGCDILTKYVETTLD